MKYTLKNNAVRFVSQEVTIMVGYISLSVSGCEYVCMGNVCVYVSIREGVCVCKSA